MYKPIVGLECKGWSHSVRPLQEEEVTTATRVNVCRLVGSETIAVLLADEHQLSNRVRVQRLWDKVTELATSTLREIVAERRVCVIPDHGLKAACGTQDITGVNRDDVGKVAALAVVDICAATADLLKNSSISLNRGQQGCALTGTISGGWI